MRRYARQGTIAVAMLGLLLIARRAHAIATAEHEPAGDACAQAATYFPEDESDPARRARLGCRRELFARQIEEDRQREDTQADEERDENLDSWMRKQDMPVRIFRRNAVDLFGGTGLTSYGITGSWVLWPQVEAEIWFGRRNVSEAQSTGYLQDSRSCIGARFKWLLRPRGNLTPLASAGAADCWANVAFQSYQLGVTPGPGGVLPPSDSIGSAAAHVATGSAGLAWMDKSGVRASVEYVYTYAFYTQATRNDDARSLDDGLRSVWEQRLTSERGGVRLQVGYAF